MKTKLFLFLFLFSCVDSIMAQATIEGMTVINSTALARSGNRWSRVVTDIKCHNQYPVLQKTCSKNLFGKDYADMQLQEAYDQYMKTTYNKVAASYSKKKTKGQKNILTTSFVGGKEGKFFNYSTIFYNKWNDKADVKEITRERHFIYDVAQGKVLTLADVFQPEAVNEVNQFIGKHAPQMELNSNMILVGAIKEGKFVGKHYFFEECKPDFFTDQFKALINYDSIMAQKHKADSLLAVERAIQYRQRMEQQAITNSSDSNASGGVQVQVFDVVEQMPEFPGGYAALMKWLSDNVKYPSIAEENGIQGRVVCTLVVERDGSITDIKVIHSIDPSLDSEALRVLKKMPKWIPGKQKGKPVRVKFTVPVTFRLQG